MLTQVPKKLTTVDTAFNTWWTSQGEDFQRAHDKSDLKRGFKLGYTAGRRKNTQRYTFYVRKMRITVWAENAGTARGLAQQEADKRFNAAGLQPPKAGWILRSLGSTST